MALTFVPGFAQCGVFVTLRASRRICAVTDCEKRNVRNTLASRLAYPGPRYPFAFDVPNRAAVTGANDVVSNQGLPGPTPPNTSNGLTSSARCALLGAFNDAPLDVIVMVEPENAVKYALSCQPPTMAAAIPSVR